MNRSSLAFGMTLPPAKYRPPVHRGTAHHAAKLSELDVDEIRRSSEPQQVIADRFGVHQSRISRIRAWKAWVQSETEVKG